MKNQNTEIHLLGEKADYYSFLLRIWKIQDIKGYCWHLSLENPLTHELIGFNDLLAFNNYLTQFFEKKQVVSKYVSKEGQRRGDL